MSADRQPDVLRISAGIAIIGAGPGGAITAALLAEAGRDVLLIEEGPYLPLESCAPFSRAEMVQKYRNGGITVTVGPTKISYVEGRCVGGGSEINSGLYHRTPADRLAAWRQEFQVQGLMESDLEPFFLASEKDLGVSYLPGPAPLASLKLHEGASRLGWKSLEVPRWFVYEPVNPPGTAEGKRQSMTRTFVPQFLAAGGRLVTETRVRRLSRRRSGWVLHGQQRLDGERVRRVAIDAETVFVAGGAIQTAALLRRSGIRRHVGNALHMHPTVKVVAEFADEVNRPGMGVPVHQVKEFAPRYSFGCSISSTPYLALALADQADTGRLIAERGRHMAIYYAMTCGGRGSVRPLPGFRDPLVRYYLNQAEENVLGEALPRLCECLFMAGAQRLYPAIVGGGCLTSTADLTKLPRRLAANRANLMTIHLFSTCPMGENIQRCAADSYGVVHGMKNLHLADASLLCGPPGVNPQGSIMAIARRNVARFLGNI